mmetsp:Transcript_36382/g.104829  ORF Transcript_36382/g.104829 Transcript_36382/m.104829 type:complete len:238 (+) Transcript_36382:159-872(+)
MGRRRRNSSCSSPSTTPTETSGCQTGTSSASRRRWRTAEGRQGRGPSKMRSKPSALPVRPSISSASRSGHGSTSILHWSPGCTTSSSDWPRSWSSPAAAASFAAAALALRAAPPPAAPAGLRARRAWAGAVRRRCSAWSRSRASRTMSWLPSCARHGRPWLLSRSSASWTQRPSAKPRCRRPRRSCKAASSAPWPVPARRPSRFPSGCKALGRAWSAARRPCETLASGSSLRMTTAR